MDGKAKVKAAENLSVHAIGPGEDLRIETPGTVVELRTMGFTFGNKVGVAVSVESRFFERVQAAVGQPN